MLCSVLFPSSRRALPSAIAARFPISGHRTLAFSAAIENPCPILLETALVLTNYVLSHYKIHRIHFDGHFHTSILSTPLSATLPVKKETSRVPLPDVYGHYHVTLSCRLQVSNVICRGKCYADLSISNSLIQLQACSSRSIHAKKTVLYWYQLEHLRSGRIYNLLMALF